MMLEIEHPERFVNRHNGLTENDVQQMLELIGEPSLESLISKTVPQAIRLAEQMNLPAPMREAELLAHLQELADQNVSYRSHIGMGYYPNHLPTVIKRNILENPGWYTQYTPYQAEIAQGRLEALINFQTLVCDLTGMPLANASLLDEATAAAEAMTMIHALTRNQNKSEVFLVSEDVHPQTLAVLQTRAEPLGISLRIEPSGLQKLPDVECFGVLLQYPTTHGSIYDLKAFVEEAHSRHMLVAVATDLLALTLLTPPGEFGADVVVGSAQRFGIPMGYGGPHPAFFATRDDYKRHIPGRLAGVSIDTNGKVGYRLTLQTREQHIKREKATSNICTAQVLLAVIAGMYAVYHGPEQLKKIALRTHLMTRFLAEGLIKLGYHVDTKVYFDTISITFADNAGQRLKDLRLHAENSSINLRYIGEDQVGISFDETTELSHVQELLAIFAHLVGSKETNFEFGDYIKSAALTWSPAFVRQSSYLTHPVFNSYHSETEMLRYMRRLESRDLSLTTSMIPLGSCTMKLNATSEMIPVTFPKFGNIHPFAPTDQAKGYQTIIRELEDYLTAVTGFAGVSLQPNSGAQGEYTGLMVIREYFKHHNQAHRNIALIPTSAHGTNPASAVMAGMDVVLVKCDEKGNIDVADLEQKAIQHKDRLAALMVTYPSTHGVFEAAIKHICQVIHDNGGLVYMDGANMNAQVGLTNPANIGADVCHLNLHKTFCIPHGGGGPGMGPIGVTAKLVPYLPGHPVIDCAKSKHAMSAVSAAPWGSGSILLISYAYIRMMGAQGLQQATEYAILNANYIKAKLAKHFPILYANEHGMCAHEFIIDFRPFKMETNIEVEDVAKRLIDYSYHAPTVSFPVPGTMMIEPTESESLAELDRFCAVMIQIRHEIQEIADGLADKVDNVLKNAPHTASMVVANEWTHSYDRQKAAYPLPYLFNHKFWPFVSRVNNSFGDRNVVCTCPPIEAYETAVSQPATVSMNA
jgi:glycine dehydrogenase